MDLQGRHVTIVGLGRTAVALSRLLLRARAHPFVTERDDDPRKAHLRAALEEMGVPYECGGHTPAALARASLVVPSPGAPPSAPPVVEARTRGIEVRCEMDVAFAFCRAPILAVTGTNGKTTATELLRACVAACGHRVALAGNNDRPFSEEVMEDPAPDYVVLEVSSYQLDLARTFRPWIGAVLNVTPDHLARHGTMEAYAAAKARMFQAQQPGDTAVLNADDAWVSAMAVPEGVATRYFSLEGRREPGLWLDAAPAPERGVVREGEAIVARAADTLLPGRHNLENVLAVLTMLRAGAFAWERVIEGLRAFRGVEHRIEMVLAVRGVTFYNDSKSTNVDSLRVALASFTAPVVLIAGGEGKGSDYRVLRDLVAAHVKHLVTLGEDAAKIEAAYGDLAPTERATDMADAVRRAARAAAPGDAVLLSPACASFDMFENFEHRGRVFKACVQDWAAAAGGGSQP